MIKRTIEISQNPVHLTVRNDQLLLIAKDGQRAELARAPCEDIGLILVDHPQTTYTHAAFAALLAHDAAVILCGRNHLPAGILLPLAEHSEVVHRINDQIAAPKPLKKQLWRQIVQAKIRAQAANLGPDHPKHAKLLAWVRKVRSDDASNVEAHAAKAYWAALFDEIPFRRDPDGDGINALLNYGYAVVRAAVARAIVTAGLLPALGLHHSNRSNAFCLADDLVEPLRPLVDRCVRELAASGATSLTPQTKRPLLELLTATVKCEDQYGPLMVALHRYTASLVRCYQGQDKALTIPILCFDEVDGPAPTVGEHD
jgi:CRISPR-associated protein Cas1